ncbi:hypothetical protein A2129_00520 [Candidatus Woesebacteria bacterium GWC1_42_13]|uniref:Putative pre-16S rRNA nuclease n=3 Tax=Candidatus Woeseibacteriota TaxID=1752722 RepID=A0A1F7WUT7_9BACT|nr:MAG: hypothetical protein A2112_01775 [Candidatus Woesebacteria bacterium GWA1_42_12]OGM06397.1 MAG: hypothetical protein A2129_00520 [Candidatus Woesebacteria bacterium GWC1_42_13]
MTILGVDWGEAKVGLALAVGIVAEPYSVVRYKSKGILMETLREIIKKEEVGCVVLGISEGESEKLAREFGDKVSEASGVGVVFWDETLSTKEAQDKAIEAGISRKKRKELEDAFAAAVMLQSYLDSNA